MLLEKEKLLVMSNFSFSNSVFKRLELQTCKHQERVKCTQTDVCNLFQFGPVQNLLSVNGLKTTFGVQS